MKPNTVMAAMFEAKGLTSRHKDVLDVLAKYPGDSQKQLAERLSISLYTFKVHLQHIRRRTGISSLVELVLWWVAFSTAMQEQKDDVQHGHKPGQ